MMMMMERAGKPGPPPVQISPTSQRRRRRSRHVRKGCDRDGSTIDEQMLSEWSRRDVVDVERQDETRRGEQKCRNDQLNAAPRQESKKGKGSERKKENEGECKGQVKDYVRIGLDRTSSKQRQHQEPRAAQHPSVPRVRKTRSQRASQSPWISVLRLCMPWRETRLIF